MRVLAPLFETTGVDIVFNGHVHNYQRSYPLRFAPDPPPAAKAAKPDDRVAGRFTIDRGFDGETNTRPSGVIYVVSGAGGNRLYNPEQQGDRRSMQAFTDKYDARHDSITVADVRGSRLTVRQVASTGEVLDRFTVTRPEAARPAP